MAEAAAQQQRAAAWFAAPQYGAGMPDNGDLRTKEMKTEIKTAAERIRLAFAWSYADDLTKEATLEQNLSAMIANIDPDERDRLGWRFAMLAQMCRR
jgi:hypothetical protein